MFNSYSQPKQRIRLDRRKMRVTLTIGLMLFAVFLLSACDTGQEQSPTPSSVGLLVQPPKLPTRAPRTPTASAELAPTPAPTPEPGEPTAAPENNEEPVVERETPSSGRQPGAYVRSASAILAETPGGRTLVRVPAGTRLGILEQSGDGNWLRVVYQPDPDAAGQTGWVRVSNLSIFADLDDLVESDESAMEEETETGTETDAPALGAAKVLANRLNVRSGPGTNQRIIDSLKQGDQVQLLGRTENSQWLQVQIEGDETGWAAARWLDPTVAVSSLPVAGSATSAVPNPTSSSRGKIVFQTRNGGDIYIVNANGTGLQRLTYGFDPALSPDGREVAFTRHDESAGLWTINVDGSGGRLLHGANRPRSPTWSPDGQTIAFELNTENRECRVTPLGCYTEDEIRKEFYGNDCWTYPNVGTFCITDFRLSSLSIDGVQTYETASGNVRDLPTLTVANAPYHHPSTQDVLHLNRDGLAITKAVGDEPPVQLIESKEGLGPGVYSPDGQYIYASRRSGDHWDIWRYRADGSNPQALTAPPGIRDAPIHYVSPTISPDGRSILYLTNVRKKWELWIMDIDGGNPRPFAPQALANIEFDYGFAKERMADWGS